METQVSYSAVVVIDESAQVNLYSYFFGGNWMWYGHCLNVIGFDVYGCKMFQDCGSVDCGTMYFDNSEDAIVHAVAQFDGTEGGAPSFGLGSADNLIGVEVDPETVPCASCGGSFLRGASQKYCDSCLKGERDYSTGHDEDYPGDVLPTGWDAADHKAMYE